MYIFEIYIILVPLSQFKVNSALQSARFGWWTLAFQTCIKEGKYAFSLVLIHGYYSCSMVGLQSKFTSKSLWSEQLLSAMVNSRFCVSAGVLMLLRQMFISQLAFHLSMENNGLSLCSALSWANKVSYLTSNQAIIHSALNTWDWAEVQQSSFHWTWQTFVTETVLPR